MSETATIVVSIIGAAAGVVGVLGLMLRILMTNVAREFEASARRISELKGDLNRRIDAVNDRIDATNDRIDGRIDSLATEMHQRFDRVQQELAENRERMAKLEGALEGFLAGRRDRDAA